MNTMTYKGLSARVEFDADDEIFVGKIAGINDVVGFHSDTAHGLKEAFHEAVEDYLDACQKVGKEPERAFSGKLMLRVKPELHQALALAAELSGKSLNQFGEELLGSAVVGITALKPSDSKTDLVRQILQQSTKNTDALLALRSASLPGNALLETMKVMEESQRFLRESTKIG
jgi:predicted HicB family RNase H-like nuclease